MMKKILSSIGTLAIIVLIFACTADSREQIEVDNSLVAKSKLSKLITSNRSVKDLIRQVIETEAKTAIDSPGGPSDCPGEGYTDFTVAHNLVAESNIMNTFLDEMRVFKNTHLELGETGINYKDTYYYFGNVLKNQNISLADANEFLDIIPTITGIYNRLSENNSNNVVISNSKKNEILDFIEYYRPKVSSSNVINDQILDAIKQDVINLTNRNPQQINTFLAD